MGHEIEIQINGEEDTQALGRRMAQYLPTQCVVALNGTLGAGKTRLVRAFAEACGIDEKDVTSPTFTLWQTYQGTRRIHHLDAYRIRDEDEFDALGVEECFGEDATTFIEWAERVAGCLPTDLLIVHIEVLDETSRRVTFKAPDGALAAALQQLT